MHTGYDSFWMYQNNRHEPVLDLPNNDNQSHAVLTDSYKHVQSGGHPSLLNGCIPSQNNISRSQENDRTPHSRYMWPNSVYSVPLKPSYVNNFHPQAPFSAQSNNSGYPPQYTQQNLSDGSDLRNNKNSNPSVSQVLNRNGNSTLIRNNQNSSGHSGRIRVRDVFSLNKCTVPNSDSYQNEQYGYYYYNSECTSKNQNQFVNYGRGSLPPANLPPPYYASHQVTNHTGSGQQFQLSSPPFYQQNFGSQHQFGVNRQGVRNLSFEASKTNTQNAPLLQEALQKGINQEPCVSTNKRIPLDSINDNEAIIGAPKRNLVNENNSLGTVNSGYGDRIGLNNGFICERSNLKNVPQIQNPQDNNSFRSNCSNASRTASVKSPGYEHSTGQETVIKISIPHSGQNTFISLSDCGNATKSSGLPCLLDANDKFCNEWIQGSANNAREKSVQNVSVPQTCQTSLSNTQTPASVNLLSPNSESGCRKNSTVPPRKRFCQVKEPFLNLNEENLNAFLNSTPASENSTDNSISRVRNSGSIAKETTFQEKITLSALQVKQENAAVDSPKVTEKKKVLFEIIKREKDSIDDTETQAESLGEGSNPVEEPLISQVEFTEDSSVDVKGFCFPPEVVKPSPAEPVASDNSTENLNNPSDKRKETQNKRIPSEKVKYKSKINRNKLDMLIQFLEMDKDSVENIHKTAGDKSKKETGVNHNRRKLSKTSVVKNKNNSREMISMKSNKSGRAETSKASPPAARSAKVDKEKEGRNSADANEKSKTDETASESQTKSNPSGATHREEDDSSEKSAEPKNANGSAGTEMKSEESSAKRNRDIQKAEDLFNKYRTLRTSKTIFCVNCNLFSTVDLFWVNLATGELKCLNCFKKIESESNTGNNMKTNRKEKSENPHTLEQGADNDIKETYSAKCSSKCAEGLPRSIRETIKQEPFDSVELPTPPRKETTVKGSNSKEERQAKNSEDRSKGDTKNEKTKRRESGSKESCSVQTVPKESSVSTKATTSVEFLKKEQTKEQSLRKNISKEDLETSKRQETVRKSTQKEEKLGEEHAKKDKKFGEGSGQIRRRSESKDFVRCKSPEEPPKKEARTDSGDKSVIKTKECIPALTDNSTEQATRKSTKHEHSERARSQSVSKENKIIHKAKESESVEESRPKSTNNSQKCKKVESIGLAKKRKNSDEDISTVKVHIAEDQTKRDLKPVLYRISTGPYLKEDIERHRTKATDNQVLSTKNSDQKVKGSSFPKDDSEHLSSSSKKKETLKEDANYQKIKAYEETKQKAGDSGKSKEHKQTKNEVRQLVETFEKRKNKQDDGSHFGEPHKHASVVTENKEKEKSHPSQKTESTPSRLLKENQNTKVRNEKNKDKSERKKNSDERKDKGKNGAPERKDKRKLENSYNKKRLSDRSEGKSDKIQTENRHGKTFDKTAEGYLGGKTETQEEKHCNRLFSKLLKKTKKLSVELLGEA